MARKYVHYGSFLFCLLLCMSLPFLMLAVEQRLEMQLDSATKAPCTVEYTEDGQVVTQKKVVLSLQNDTAVITTKKGDVVTSMDTDQLRGTSPSSVYSRGMLYAGLSTLIVSVLLIVLLIPLNAFLIQFSIEHTPDGRFHPFDAA